VSEENKSPLLDVIAELHKALRKFPTWPTDPLHALAVLGEEFGELTKAILQLVYEPHKSTADDVRMEAIQTAAMALRLLVSLDQYEYKRGAQHTQPALAVVLSPASPIATDQHQVSGEVK
jgi:NTP pyrophosphatase (non-canonical NTP hydrolase)